MSAIITPPPAHSAAAAKFAPDGGGESDLSAAGGLGPFAAMFRNLLDRQTAGANADAPLPLVLTDSLAGTTDAPVNPLDALQPFLDTLGQAPAETMPPEDMALETPSEAMPADALAVAMPPANADDTPAIPAAATSAGNDAAARKLAQAMPDTIFAKSLPDAASTVAGQAKELSRGREFSTQLVTAIENSKEQPHAPGNTATAVQQVIAAASPQHAHAVPRAPLPVAQPVGSSGWSEEVGNRISWMATRLESRAELVLTPPQMGRIEVSLAVNGDQATASFVSANLTVREALEAALPRLREILAEAGIQLGEAQVGAENARQSAQQDKNGDNSAAGRTGRADLASTQGGEAAPQHASGLKLGRGLVDTFA